MGSLPEFLPGMIDARQLSFKKWIELILDPNTVLFPDTCLPSEKIATSLFRRLKRLSEKDTKGILRRFLVNNCAFGRDDDYRETVITEILAQGKELKTEFQYRLLHDELPWEGLTWVLDLLPQDPQGVIDILIKYEAAHWYVIPDHAVWGIQQSRAIIRSRYIHWEHPKDVFANIEPIVFEQLVALLYERLGYECAPTPITGDDGIDIIAHSDQAPKKELILIQCKRYLERKVRVSEIRELLGAVTSKKATKGVLVSTAQATGPAQRLAEANPRLEIISGDELTQLLNTHIGKDWPRNYKVHIPRNIRT